MASITLRGIRKSDLNAYKALRLQGLASHPEAFGTAYEDAVGEPDSAVLARLQRSLDRDGAAMFVAVAGGSVVGMVNVFRDCGAKVDHSANVCGVFVHPQFRGQRIAERLVRKAIAWCKTEGVRIARLTVATSNTPAIRCYHRCGFIVNGIGHEVIRVGDAYHDELFMWYRISQAD